MKALKVGLIIFSGILFLAVAGGWLFLSTLDANRYVPAAVDAVAKATGRQLSVGHAGIGFSFNKGLALTLNNVSLSDDPQFSSQPFVTAGQVVLVIDVRATLLEKSLVIAGVTVVDPQATVIRTKDGRINAAAMNAAVMSAPSSGAAPVAKPAAAASLPLLVVKKIMVSGGVLHFRDYSFEPAIVLDVSRIALNVSNFSFNAPFDLTLEAALFSNEPDVAISGRAGVDPVGLAARLENVKCSLTLDRILPLRLNNACPMMKPAGFKQSSGAVNVQIKRAVVGAKGVDSLEADADASISNTVLEGGNLLASALKGIPMFPDLLNTVLADLPPETQEDIRKGITVIDRLEVLLSADRQIVTVRKAEMSTRDLAVSASGTLKLPAELDMAVKLFIAPKLSLVLVNKVPDLGGLSKDDGRIYVPLALRGSMMKPNVLVDMDYLTKKLLLNRGRQELEKALGDPAVGRAVGDLLNSFFKGK